MRSHSREQAGVVIEQSAHRGVVLELQSVAGRYGTIVPGPAYQQASNTCRQYTHTIYIDGKPQTARGAACRNPDGTWTPIS